MSEYERAVESFERVEIVLTKSGGERIEVDVDKDGLLYIDVESNERCKLNYAEAWGEVPDDQKERLRKMFVRLAQSLDKVVEQ